MRRMMLSLIWGRMERGVGRFLSVGSLGVLLLKYSFSLFLFVKWIGANKVLRAAVYDLRKYQGAVEECFGYQAFYTC